MPSLRLATVDAGTPGSDDDLDVRWSDGLWVEPKSGELILSRWVCTKLTASSPAEESATSAPSESLDGLAPPVEGAGTLTLTSQRLIGSIDPGVLFTLEFDALERVTVMRERTMESIRDTGVRLDLVDGGVVVADLGESIDEERHTTRSDRVVAALSIIAPAVERQRPAADLEHTELLNRALAGDWDLEEDDLVLRLRPAPDEARTIVSAVPAGVSLAEPTDDRSPSEGLIDDSWQCRACGSSNAPDNQFCTSCGGEKAPARVADLDDAPPTRSCELCDCEVLPGPEDRFCRSCGHAADVHRERAPSVSARPLPLDVSLAPPPVRPMAQAHASSPPSASPPPSPPRVGGAAPPTTAALPTPPPHAPAMPAPVAPAHAQGQSTNGFAIASLVLGILWIYWIGSILSLIFGYIGKSQIDASGNRQGGRGLAIAGIVLGWIGIGVLILLIVLGVGVGLSG